MKLLAFETATEACSVALWLDGEVLERFDLAPRRHAELALPWADELLAQAGVARAQLDAIALGRGPGAFTGVRLAVAVGQGVALALDRPVVPVSTLAALAMRADPAPQSGGAGPRVVAAIDARMGEVYAASFQLRDGEAIALTPEAVLPPDRFQPLDAAGDWHGVGTGFAAAEGALVRAFGAGLASVDAAALPHAGDVARLAARAFARGEAVAPERVEPAYLRDNVALTLEQQRKARG
jgi:tRNA threonylcarbamoyladenosine biosynthesis protein TsaB